MAAYNGYDDDVDTYDDDVSEDNNESNNNDDDDDDGGYTSSTSHGVEGDEKENGDIDNR